MAQKNLRPHKLRFVVGLLMLQNALCQKDKDESRPYEFGFTIAGEQHRYEKKDVNGIIQGEFGFITADGVYHVTVYATDENGSFRILSMKNTRISEPLDKGGKPTFEGKIELPPEIQSEKPALESKVQPLLTSEPVNPLPLAIPAKPTPQPLYDFTTASTYRNGCGGCGIVTKAPDGPFAFQNPAFRDPSKSPPPPNSLITDQKPYPPAEQQTPYTSAPLDVTTARPGNNLALPISTGSSSSQPISPLGNLGGNPALPNLILSSSANGTALPNPASSGFKGNSAQSNVASPNPSVPNLINTNSVPPSSISAGFSNGLTQPNLDSPNYPPPPSLVTSGFNNDLARPNLGSPNSNYNAPHSSPIHTDSIPQNSVPSDKDSTQTSSGFPSSNYNPSRPSSAPPSLPSTGFGNNPTQVNLGSPSSNYNPSRPSSVYTNSAPPSLPSTDFSSSPIQVNLGFPSSNYNPSRPSSVYTNSAQPSVPSTDIGNSPTQVNLDSPSSNYNPSRPSSVYTNSEPSSLPSTGFGNSPTQVNSGSSSSNYNPSLPSAISTNSALASVSTNSGNNAAQSNPALPGSINNKSKPPPNNLSALNLNNQILSKPFVEVPAQQPSSTNPIHANPITGETINQLGNKNKGGPKRPSATQITINNGVINVPGNEPIRIQDKYPNMVNGLPAGITEGDITDLLYKFNYTFGFHGHYEKGWKNGTKTGGYFVNGRDGISRVVTYIADENGYRPKVSFINLGLGSEDTPKPDSEKKFGLKSFEFVWYPVK